MPLAQVAATATGTVTAGGPSLTVSDLAQVAVAVATFMLAVPTAYVAWKTKALVDEAREESKAFLKQIEASWEQARTSRSILEASIQPWLTLPPGVVSVEWHDIVGDAIKVFFDLHNVGAGLAIIQAVGPFRERFTVEGKGSAGETVTRFGFAESPAIAPGESTKVSFLVQQVDRAQFFSQDQSDGFFYINVPYTDASGGQLVLARIAVTRSKSANAWLVHQIAYTRDGEAAPFVVVESDAAIQSFGPPWGKSSSKKV